LYQLSINTHKIERCPPWSCVVCHGRALSAMVVRCPLLCVVRRCALSAVVCCPPLCSVRRCALSAVVVRCVLSTVIRRLFVVVCPWLPVVHRPSLRCPSPVVGHWSQIRSALSLKRVDHPSIDHPSIRASFVERQPSEHQASTVDHLRVEHVPSERRPDR